MTDSAAKSALEHAWHLVRKGEVADARFWASQASKMDPGLEEPWLILAALSDPNDSFDFLKRALEINPRSRRGNRGVVWAETKTGRSFEEYTSSFHDYISGNSKPFNEETLQSLDLTPFTFEIEPPNQRESFARSPLDFDFEPQIKSTPVESPPQKETIGSPPEEIEPSQPMIIRRRRPRQKQAPPVNPWSVLLPYTVSFVIFFFMATIWLLSGLPNVKAESIQPDYTTEEMVKQILTAIPKATATITPSPTPSPSKTPTKIPTITQTFTPQPTGTEIPSTPEATKDGELASMPILIGDQILDTLEDGRWIEVDLAHQKVRAYAGETMLREFIVSTGTTAHPTVKGNYHIYIKDRYADMRGPGYYLPNVPYTMYFFQSYGLHGTYWHHNFGTPMSHGCVNLKTDDAAWLFEWASIGTLVHVH